MKSLIRFLLIDVVSDNLESVSNGASHSNNDLREKFGRRVNDVPFLKEGIFTLLLGRAKSDR